MPTVTTRYRLSVEHQLNLGLQATFASYMYHHILINISSLQSSCAKNILLSDQILIL